MKKFLYYLKDVLIDLVIFSSLVGFAMLMGVYDAGNKLFIEIWGITLIAVIPILIFEFVSFRSETRKSYAKKSILTLIGIIVFAVVAFCGYMYFFVGELGPEGGILFFYIRFGAIIFVLGLLSITVLSGFKGKWKYIILAISVIGFTASYSTLGGCGIKDDSCRSGAMVSRALESHDARLCLTLKNSFESDSCLMNIMWVEQKVETCNLVQNINSRAECFNRGAGKTNDISWCKNILPLFPVDRNSSDWEKLNWLYNGCLKGNAAVRIN